LEFPDARRWIDLLDFSQQPAISFDRTVQVGNWQADGKRLDLCHDRKSLARHRKPVGIRTVVREGVIVALIIHLAVTRYEESLTPIRHCGHHQKHA
jgi:hypothetical protein